MNQEADLSSCRFLTFAFREITLQSNLANDINIGRDFSDDKKRVHYRQTRLQNIYLRKFQLSNKEVCEMSKPMNGVIEHG